MKRNNTVFNYDHQSIEKKWSKAWKDLNIDSPDIDSPQKPFYNLMMFPYPSAEGLHVGNMYAFTGADIYGRYRRMQGLTVFEPMGLDGFGIHSENYALKIGRHPMEHARITQKNFYAQLSTIGAMIDWNRTVETYNPQYYKWTQWLFVQMFKHGMAYRDRALVNWCPACKTVLADEQVIDGVCERCGNTVIRKYLEQWFFRITAYAEKLRGNLETLDWTEKVKIAQREWIGRKEGINITYPVYDGTRKVGEITCFSTHPNTNYGATFVVLAPEHPFVETVQNKHIKDTQGLHEYVTKTKQKTEQERAQGADTKTGVPTGLYCVNQLTGRHMPLFVSDFVLMDVGTGAVVGVPAHDERDFAFAREFNLPSVKVVDFSEELHVVIRKDFCDATFVATAHKQGLYAKDLGKEIAVVATGAMIEKAVSAVRSAFSTPHAYAQVDGAYKGIITQSGIVEKREAIESFAAAHSLPKDDIWLFNEERYPFCYTGPGVMVHSDNLNGLTTGKANETIKDLMETNGWGKRVVTYHLRDWLVSRQRYWGPPIPMIYCKECASKGQSWFTTQESKAQKHNSAYDWAAGWYPVEDANLPVELPTIEDVRPGDDGIAPLAKHNEFYAVPCPHCGAQAVRETDVSDTFLDSSWYFLRYPSTDIQSDPFSTTRTETWLPVDMYTGGAEHSVLHLMYSRFVTMALNDWGYLTFDEPFTKFFAHGLVIKDGAKMSKSKGNIVNPDEYIKLYGADSLRLYLMFMGPFEHGGDFRDSAMEGMSRWIKRVWKMFHSVIRKNSPDTVDEIERTLNKLIDAVTHDTEKRRYNTAIAKMMEFTNLVSDMEYAMTPDQLDRFIRILAPYAPFVTEELWHILKGRTISKKEDSVHHQLWPDVQGDTLIDEEAVIVIQVNGKYRGKFAVKQEQLEDKDEVEKRARSMEKIRSILKEKPVKNVIYVPGKIINFVL